MRQAWIAFGQQQLDGFLEQFAEVVLLPLRTGTLGRRMDLMCQYDLKSYDAVHLALATANRLADFAPSDREFEHVTGVHVRLARDERPPLD